MKVIADISIVPMGVEASVSKYIKVAHQVLVDADLSARLCPYGTVVEGEYGDVTAAMELAMKAVFDMGVPRVTMTIKMGARVDKEQSAQDKLDAVLKK